MKNEWTAIVGTPYDILIDAHNTTARAVKKLNKKVAFVTGMAITACIILGMALNDIRENRKRIEALEDQAKAVE